MNHDNACVFCVVARQIHKSASGMGFCAPSASTLDLRLRGRMRSARARAAANRAARFETRDRSETTHRIEAASDSRANLIPTHARGLVGADRAARTRMQTVDVRARMHSHIFICYMHTRPINARARMH